MDCSCLCSEVEILCRAGFVEVRKLAFIRHSKLLGVNFVVELKCIFGVGEILFCLGFEPFVSLHPVIEASVD